jgi:hypothetical protein
VTHGRRGAVGQSIALVAVLFAWLSPDARAHGTIRPQTAQRGATAQFVVTIPNDSINVPLTGFRLTPPSGVTVEATEVGDAWVTRMEGRTLVWAGGNVPGGDQGVFTFRASLDTAEPTITFQAEESYRGLERTGVFPLSVALIGEAAGAVASEGFPFLLVALVGGLVTLAALAAVLALRTRSS